MTIFSPRASAMGHHLGDERVSGEWARACNDLIARVVGLFPDTFIGVCQLPQSPGAELEASVAELERVRPDGLRRLQPQPGPERREVDLPTAHRPVLVPHLREDGRARRARHGARLEQLQPGLPRHRRALHQRGHHGVHAVHPRRPVRRLPGPAAGDPARRRRRPLPLGPLPRARRHAEEAAAGRARDAERVLRHVRLPPARHRPALRGHRRRQHPVRLRDGRRRARHRPRDRSLLRRHEAVHRRARPEGG